MAKPDEIRAVRKVLYEPERLRKVNTHVSSIVVAMNLNPRARLQPNDSRIVAGGGPNWFLPNGELSEAVRDASGRCRKVAQLVREMRRELAAVDFDAADKRNLLAALDAEAKAWDARAAVWGAQQKPRLAVDLARITGPQTDAIRHFKHVTAYLHKR